MVNPLRAVTGSDVMSDHAHSSRAGEDNSVHVACAVLVLAAVAVVAGLINVRVSGGIGK